MKTVERYFRQNEQDYNFDLLPLGLENNLGFFVNQNRNKSEWEQVRAENPVIPLILSDFFSNLQFYRSANQIKHSYFSDFIIFVKS